MLCQSLCRRAKTLLFDCLFPFQSNSAINTTHVAKFRKLREGKQVVIELGFSLVSTSNSTTEVGIGVVYELPTR